MKTAAALFLVITCLSKSHGWTCRPGPQHSGAVQIDAGQGQVVMRDEKSGVFFLTGSTWTRLGSVGLKHVSVGPAGIWGVDGSDKVYKYVHGDFLLFQGQNLQQVDAGSPRQIVGVTSSSSIHCLTSDVASALKQHGSRPWITFPGRLMYFSCSSYGCWGVNSVQNIYFTASDSCQHQGWTQVDGLAVTAEIGTDGTVFVVNEQGNVFQRTGISADAPYGTGWYKIPMSETFRHASYDLGNLWLVINNGVIMKCTQSVWTCSPGPQHPDAVQIDAGQGQVVMRDGNRDVFFLTGSTWTKLGSVGLKHVSVGPAGIWGVDESEKFFKYVAGDFIELGGPNTVQVDAGGEGQVVGVTSSDSTYCLKSGIASAISQAGSPSWRAIDNKLLYISCGSRGCWTVSPSQQIFFQKVVPDSCGTGDPIIVNGEAVIVEAGTDGAVVMLTEDGKPYERTGTSPAFPQGTGWTLIPVTGHVRHISYDQGVLWGVDDTGAILKCTK